MTDDERVAMIEDRVTAYPKDWAESRDTLWLIAQVRELKAGFTWDDVDVLRSLARSRPDGTFERQTLASLADRIAALLPPRGSDG